MLLKHFVLLLCRLEIYMAPTQHLFIVSVYSNFGTAVVIITCNKALCVRILASLVSEIWCTCADALPLSI